MIETNETKVKEILGNDFNKFSDQEKLDFLFARDDFEESFLEKIIVNHPDQVEWLFNSEILSSLSTGLITNIFSYTIKEEGLLSFACKANPDLLRILLSSRVFTKLNDFQQLEILQLRSDHNPNSALFLKVLTKKYVNCLSILVESPTIINLGAEKGFELLNDKDLSGKHVLHRTIKGPIDYFKILLNSQMFNLLTSEHKFLMLNGRDYNSNLLLLDIINQNSEKNFWQLLFNSSVFDSFNETQQKQLLYLNYNNSKMLWVKLFDRPNNIQPFVEHGPKFLSVALIEFVHNYYWEDCCPEEMGKVLIRERISFVDILNVASYNALYKTSIDEKGFSLLYYFASYGIAISDLNKYQNEQEFAVIAKQGYEIIIQERSLLFTYNKAKQDILVITGKYTRNDIISGLEAALHQKGINVLSINANYYPNGVDSEIKQIISEYPRKKHLDFIIVHAHGNAKDINNSDVALYVYERGNKITSKSLFQDIVSELGETKPITIFLTSCNGQLSTNIAQQALPKESKLITVGEKTNLTDHRTQVWDIQNIAKTISDSFVLEDDVEFKPYIIEKMLIDYLMHIKLSNLVKGIPTYTISGQKTVSLADFKGSSSCLNSLNHTQKEQISNKLCNDQDIECKSKLNKVLNSWNEKNFGEAESIRILQASHNNTELGIVSAIKFMDSLYCQNIFDHEFTEQNKDFCCSNSENNSNWCIYGGMALMVGLVSTIAYSCYAQNNDLEHLKID